MGSLRAADLRFALEFLEELGAATDLDGYAETLIYGLDHVIPAELVAYNEVNPVSRRAVIVGRPDINAMLPGAEQILEEHMEDNPLVVHTARTRDGHAVKWSDFVSQRQLHRTPLWNELFRPFSIERQMVTILPAPQPLLIGIVLNRSGRDFSEHERELLNLLRPHLVTAYRNAEMRTFMSAVQDLSEEREEAMILLGPLDEPVSMTLLTTQLVAAFGSGIFPEKLRRWLAEARARAPLPPEPILGSMGNLTVEARLLAPSVIVLRVNRSSIDVEALRPLGLARRQREVLVLLAEGLTNAEIAQKLVVEPATVKKHLEHIYTKLGVTTRTAAAMQAIRALSWNE